jgi:uncharacterized protein YndB with AHSA1/START domain
MQTKTEDKSAQQELTITRIFDAPCDLVFSVWSEQDHLKHWCYPRDFTVPFSEMDFRVGGAYRTCLRSPDGQDHWVQGVYREIDAPQRLVFTHAWANSEGISGRETLVTVMFEELDERTKLTFHQAPFESVESRDSHHEGWTETLDHLAAYLAIAQQEGYQ